MIFRLILVWSRNMLASAAGILVVSGVMYMQQILAQPASAPPPKFEVASVKPVDQSVVVGVGIGFAQGRFVANSVSLQMLIGFAYDLPNQQISGGPKWLDSAYFTIEAKADSSLQIPPGLAGVVPMRLMLRSLLSDRFKLAIHKETREGQVYELVLDKAGSKLREVGGLPGQLRFGRGELIGKGASIELLVKQLSPQLEAPVIDMTGLNGLYDFDLKWVPDLSMTGGRPQGPEASPPPDLSGPSIFTAIQEELGLRLQSARAPIEILVIDHVERPDQN
jgi:uncharacterized protein (TIGR03435 family)